MRAKYATYAGGLALVAAMVGLAPTPASAQAILYNGAGIAIGIDTLGQMNVPEGLAADGVTTVNPVNSDYVGLSFFTNYGSGPQWNDATSPGCLCEGWGVAADGTSGWVDNAIGVSNLSFGSFGLTGGGSGAVVTTNLTSLPGLSVKHDYRPSVSPSLYEAIVTITNGTGAAVTDVRYNRTMDWDIPPTTFSEYVTIQGWPATALLDSCDDGFETPDPLSDCSPISGTSVEDGNFTDSNGDDHGARFTFGFGGLADGASKTFKIFYGATVNEAASLAALGAVGAEVYSLGQSVGGQVTGAPATFIFGFAGVGGTVVPVPEPTSLFLLGSGLATVLIRRRARRS